MTDKLPSDMAHPVDLYVGARLRIRRKVLGLSQTQLAEALGITFQQIQKYERGANRISASKLYEAARLLQSPVSYFFEGLDETRRDDLDDGFAQRMAASSPSAPAAFDAGLIATPRTQRSSNAREPLRSTRVRTQLKFHACPQANASDQVRGAAGWPPFAFETASTAQSGWRKRRPTTRKKGSGAWGRIRTTDTRIFNPLLYQLSYPGPGPKRRSKPPWRPPDGGEPRL